jgi:hypothetical protein
MAHAEPGVAAPIEPVEVRLHAIVDELAKAGFFAAANMQSVEVAAPFGRRRVRITIDGPNERIAAILALSRAVIPS